MVWSPSVRPYSTSENADNFIQRKPGNNLLSRKPFLDRSVNSKTPDTGKLLKQKQRLVKETATVEKQDKSPKNDLNAETFTFSFKDVEDTYDDIWPRLKRENILKIIHNYCNIKDVPPPSLEPINDDINTVFIELSTEEPQFIDEDIWNKTFDVEVPDCDLDMSL